MTDTEAIVEILNDAYGIFEGSWEYNRDVAKAIQAAANPNREEAAAAVGNWLGEKFVPFLETIGIHVDYEFDTEAAMELVDLVLEEIKYPHDPPRKKTEND